MDNDTGVNYELQLIYVIKQLFTETIKNKNKNLHKNITNLRYTFVEHGRFFVNLVCVS